MCEFRIDNVIVFVETKTSMTVNYLPIKLIEIICHHFLFFVSVGVFEFIISKRRSNVRLRTTVSRKRTVLVL